MPIKDTLYLLFTYVRVNHVIQPLNDKQIVALEATTIDNAALTTVAALPTSLENEHKTTLLSAYYELTKPGITKMVVLSASAGYYLALPQPLEHFAKTANVVNLIITVVGTTLIAAGSCALNNYIERDYDKLMKRTMNRPLPSGRLQPIQALIFGISISLLGLVLLALTNWLVVALAVATLISYVVVYTPLKRKTTLSLLVGGIPGAIPTLGGWAAAVGGLSEGAWILFGILFFWQLPHFLSLSWMYKQDYARGGFKMLAVIDEHGKTLATQSIAYILVLTATTVMLSIVGATGKIYLVAGIVLCGYFLFRGIQLFRDVSIINARKMLISSYLYLLGIIMLIFLDKV